MPELSGTTLVFGGGGVWGIAWMTGIVAGFSDAGLDVRRARVMVGTSAGSVVGAQLRGPLSTAELFQRQVDPARQTRELTPAPGSLDAMMALGQRAWADQGEKRRAVCQLALDTVTVSPEERRRSVAERLAPQGDAWPAEPLLITAVDASTCELCVFDAGSGISLVDAVTASCAVPGVWPPTPIGGRLYVDGGIWRTAENAHLAEGSASVVVLSPVGRMRPGAGDGLAADVAQLEAAGARVLVISADEASLRTMAGGPLDPATRAPAAHAGRSQAARELDAARSIFAPA